MSSPDAKLHSPISGHLPPGMYHGKPCGNILVVDDEKSVRSLVTALLLEQGHEVQTAASAEAALEIARSGWPDVILMDVVMPGLGGIEAIKRLKNSPVTAHIPAIIVTVLEDRESRLQGLQAGAEDFLSKPVDPAELTIRVRNLLRLREYGSLLNLLNHSLEAQVQSKTKELRASYIDTVHLLARLVEHSDADCASHILRLSHTSRLVAETLGLPAATCDTLQYASALHDIGKVVVPSQILLKPAPLDHEEWKTMQRHPRAGREILKQGQTPFMQMAGEIAGAHHENWDGSGYPGNLSGERIPLVGRIVALCDRYDALRSKRPYKPALDHAQVVRILCEGDGRSQPEHFDPEILALFRRMERRFAEIFDDGGVTA